MTTRDDARSFETDEPRFRRRTIAFDATTFSGCINSTPIWRAAEACDGHGTEQCSSTHHDHDAEANITALFGIYVGQSHGIPPTRTFESYGNPLMFIDALDHWIRGDGAQRTIHIESLNLKMSILDFSKISEAIANPGYGPGSYSFDTTFSTNVFNHGTKDFWSATVFGRVSGRVRGTLVMLEDDTYRFDGYYSLNPDRFDADPSNRPFLQEAATTFLSKLGATLGHKDYQINFFGEKSLSLSGQRPVKNAGTRPPEAVHRPSFGGLMRPTR
ncbi:lipid II-degrading bacteriocin [Burkholderia sp.]|jgi:hypothetical protein|uniref:lipid II-degrading bacteriocin n=1 Tax=Burkholderia sp. TaxID=36773 RepID=UPI0025867D79|nr:lipid II-degrading bacteriocin [Burkholderia sp.]